MIIDIIGTGITSNYYSWPDGHEKWSIGIACKTQGMKADLYFCFHDEPVDVFNKSDIAYLDKHNYPLDKVVEKFGSRYFTSSIAYMLALAIMKKPKEINLWGIDMEAGTEYVHQRPCVLYWIGQAEARGITVTTSSNLANPTFMYGYDNDNGLLAQLKMRMDHAEKMAIKVEDQKQKDQWIGKMVGMRDAINLVRG